MSKDIIAPNGKILHFSLERFKKDIVEGNCCFICGAAPGTKLFNNEHVIPDWILRKYDLYNERITLPNSTQYKYGSYTLPCCKECNTQLGEIFEMPIRKILSGGISAVRAQMEKDAGKLFICWLSLIFFKTHLKDKGLRMFQDIRKGEEKIGDFHFWNGLHLLHTFIRLFHTGIYVDTKIYGSFLVMPATTGKTPFDYSDSALGQGIYMKIEDMCFYYILNDCGIVNGVMEKHKFHEKITAPMSVWQSREVFLYMLKVNTHIKTRPSFYLEEKRLDKPLLTVDCPEFIDFNVPAPEIIAQLCGGLYYLQMITERLPKEIYDALCQEKFSFIFDEQGRFIRE